MNTNVLDDTLYIQIEKRLVHSLKVAAVVASCACSVYK